MCTKDGATSSTHKSTPTQQQITVIAVLCYFSTPRMVSTAYWSIKEDIHTTNDSNDDRHPTVRRQADAQEGRNITCALKDGSNSKRMAVAN
jgi:hypothetical protein